MHTKTLLLGFVAATIAVTGAVSPSLAARDKPTREQRAEFMIKRLDTNKDGKVSLDEARTHTEVAFKAFDTNGDGQISPDEMKAKRQAFREARKEWRTSGKTEEARAEFRDKMKDIRPAMLPGMRPKAFKRVDADNNGSLSLAEVTEQAGKMFKRRDTNGDGFIDATDFTRKI
jgi:Ca2+-binding EF-hand superfamily protein